MPDDEPFGVPRRPPSPTLPPPAAERPRVYIEGEEAKRFWQEFSGMRTDLGEVLVVLRDAFVPRLEAVEQAAANDRVVVTRHREQVDLQLGELRIEVAAIHRKLAQPRARAKRSTKKRPTTKRKKRQP